MGRGIKRLAPEGKKWCPDCKDFVDRTSFTVDMQKPDLLNSYCKVHLSTRRKAAYQQNTEKELDRQYRYNYGTDGETYKRLFKEQQGKCAVCGKIETRIHKGKVMRLSIDHCHKTGEIRGLLCRECNLALGHMEDDIERIQALLRYLENKGVSL